MDGEIDRIGKVNVEGARAQHVEWGGWRAAGYGRGATDRSWAFMIARYSLRSRYLQQECVCTQYCVAC